MSTPLNLRGALAREIGTVSAAAGRDVGADLPAALLLCWIADGKVNIAYGGHASADFLGKVKSWIDLSTPSMTTTEDDLSGMQPRGRA